MFKSMKQRVRPRSSMIRFANTGELVSDIRQVEVVEDPCSADLDGQDGQGGNFPLSGELGIELIYEPSPPLFSPSETKEAAPCTDSSRTHATDSTGAETPSRSITSSGGSPSWRLGENEQLDEATPNLGGRTTRRGLFGSNKQTDKSTRRKPLVRTLLCKKYNPDDDSYNDNPKVAYCPVQNSNTKPPLGPSASQNNNDEDTTDGLPPPSLPGSRPQSPVSARSRPSSPFSHRSRATTPSLQWPESPISRRPSRPSSPAAVSRRSKSPAFRSKSPSARRSKSPGFLSRALSQASRPQSPESSGLPLLSAPPSPPRSPFRAKSPCYSAQKTPIWSLSEAASKDDDDDEVKIEDTPEVIEPKIVARIEGSQAAQNLDPKKPCMTMESKDLSRKPSSIHVIRKVSQISRISGIGGEDDDDDDGDDQPGAFRRQRSLGDDSIAQIRRALEHVQKDLAYSARSGKKATREEITKKLLSVANSLESPEEQAAMRRGLSNLIAEEPFSEMSSFGRRPPGTVDQERGDGDSSSFSAWLTEIEGDYSSSGTSGQNLFSEFTLDFFLGLPPSKSRRELKQPSPNGQGKQPDEASNHQQSNITRNSESRKQAPPVDTEIDESDIGRIRTHSFERHSRQQKPIVSRRPIATRHRGYIARKISNRNGNNNNNTRAPSEEMSMDSIQSSQFRSGNKYRSSNRKLRIIRSEDDMEVVTSSRPSNGKYSSLFDHDDDEEEDDDDDEAELEESTDAIDSMRDDDFHTALEQKRQYMASSQYAGKHRRMYT